MRKNYGKGKLKRVLCFKFMDFYELFPLKLLLPESKGEVYIKNVKYIEQNKDSIFSFQRRKMHNNTTYLLLCIFLL